MHHPGPVALERRALRRVDPFGRLVDEALAIGVVVELVPPHGMTLAPEGDAGRFPRVGVVSASSHRLQPVVGDKKGAYPGKPTPRASEPAVAVGDAGRPRRGCRRRSCRSRRTGGCARCPRRGTAAWRSRRPTSRRGRRGARRSRAAVSGDSPATRLSVASDGVDDAQAGVHPAYGVGELGRRGVLDDEPAGARLHRAAQEAGPAERGHDQHAGLRALRPHGGRGADPVEPGHLDVEQGDVGLVLADRVRAPGRRSRPRRPPRGRARGSSRAESAPRTSAWSSASSSRIGLAHGATTASEKPGSQRRGDHACRRARRPARAGRSARGRRRASPATGPRRRRGSRPGRRCSTHGAARGVAVPDHVGDALADRPREQLALVGGHLVGGVRAGRPRSRRPRAPCARAPARRAGSARGSPPPRVVRRPGRRARAARGRRARRAPARGRRRAACWPARP